MLERKKLIKNKGKFCPNHPEASAYILGLCRSCYEKHVRTRDPEAHERTKKRMREFSKKHERSRTLKYYYGMTLKDYEDMFVAQDGLCAICFIDQKNLKRPLMVDHCHDTGKIRGLLCGKCNSAIGFLEENVDNLGHAAMYLQKNK